MRALVTGGAGFVGRHLTHKLLLNGWDVIVVDSLIKNSGGLEPQKWHLFDPTSFESFRFLNQDCRRFFKEHPSEYFDYVFHLAAVVGGRVTIEQDPLAVATDLSIDAEMWRWCVKARPMKVVNFSSSAAYPIHLQSSDSANVKLSEDLISFDRDLGMPDLTYGWAKLTNEYLGHIAWQRYEINSVVYRPFSGYGPDQDLSYPFPSIIHRALDKRGQEEFHVWGSGRQSRDFIHIDDCIDGILLTMDKISQGNPLNLSTGIATSFIRFAEMATSYVGYNPKIIGDTTMPEGVASRVGDTSKQKKFGFENRRSFESGIVEGLEFFLSRL
jgi:nucleoside-diphosphate-sugar epimerase